METSKPTIVKRLLDLKTLPSCSDDQKARLDKLAMLPDEAIDYSDAPYVRNGVWFRVSRMFGRGIEG